jgi:hypothetical protein
MFSITGYFFAGSKFDGRRITPQMSVLPSRAFETKTSGGFQPAFLSSVMSPASIRATSDASAERRSSEIGA